MNSIFNNTIKIEEIRGLTRRDKHNNVISKAPSLAPLDSLHSPFKQGLISGDKNLVYLETSRGCPFKCRFCTSADEKPRTFPLERIKNDLNLISQMDSKVVKLLDRSFHLGSKRTLQLLDLFLQSKKTLRFHLELNPDNISPEVIERFASAPKGRFQFEIGLQTLHEATLDLIERRMDIQKAFDNIKSLMELKKHHLHLDLIAGLPGENSEMICSSLNRVFQLFPHHLQLGILKLLPGTSLIDQAKSMGYLWDQHPPYEVLQNPLLTYQELTQFKAYAELLERLWNSNLLTNTITWLIDNLYEGEISVFFDGLLKFSSFEIVERSLQKDQVFSIMINYLTSKNRLQESTTLRELLLWDYLSQLSLSNKSPDSIVSSILEKRTLEDSGKKRLPVIVLGQESCRIINKKRNEPLAPGRYALWLKTFEKSRPLSVYHLP
ncbi:MAG: DUF4080 domain-containing protein [Proteobacteria bacterium]|nr:DUF4080 domain-containing protein [Pseudomonadota bacterium]